MKSEVGVIAPNRERHAWRQTLAVRNALLVLAVSLPLLAITLAGQWNLYRAERAIAEGTLVDGARSVSRLVDQEFERAIVVAETLAGSGALQAGDMRVFGEELARAQRRLNFGRPADSQPTAISFFRADGTLVASEGSHSRQAGQKARSASVPLAIERGASQISNIFFGPNANQFLVSAAAPVFDRREGADPHADPVGAVSVAIPRDRFLAIAEAAGLPPGSLVSIRDRNGVGVARTDADSGAVGIGAIPPVAAALASGRVGIVARDVARRDGVKATIAMARGALSGYTVAFGIPEETLAGPMNASLFRTATIGGVGLLVGIGFAFWFGRRTSRAIQGVADRAQAAAGRTETPEPTGVVEADQLIAVLAQSFAVRDASERRLRARSGRRKALLEFSNSVFSTAPEEHALAELVLNTVGSAVGADMCLHFAVSEADGRMSLVSSPGAGDLEADFRCLVEDETFCGAACVVEGARADRSADAEAGSVAALLRNLGILAYSRHPLLDGAGAVTGTLFIASRARASFEVEEIEFIETAGDVFGLVWQRIRAERMLRESEERYRTLTDATTEGVVVHRDGVVVECNDAWCRLAGYDKPEDVVGRDAYDFLDDGSRETVASTIRSGATVPYEVVGKRRDGSTFPMEIEGRWIRFKGRRLRVGIARDLSRRKKAEAALRDSEARFRGIAEATPQVVWSARADGFRDFYNPRTLEVAGVDPARMHGDGWLDFVHPDDLERCRLHWSGAVFSGTTYEIEYRLRGADGAHRWMLGRALPVLDEEGKVSRWFGTSTDITEIVEARETLAVSHEKLERLVADRTRDLEASQAKLANAARVEALGRLAGGIAHDFNNVLQAVNVSGKMLASLQSDLDNGNRYLDIIARAVERGKSITDRMLLFSRRAELAAAPMAVDPFFENLGEMLRMTLGAFVEIEVEVAAGLPSMHVDRGQLETVLVNLATNARDAMPGGGMLSIRVSGDQVNSSNEPAPNRLRPGDYVRIAVGDNGTGMGPDTLARVTDPFFTTKPVGRGTGLGLSMAHGFAMQSGGAMTIASEPGQGTEVTLWFPSGRTVVAPEPLETAAIEPICSARLLLVDDDELVREVVAEGLRSAGFAVVAVESGSEALAILEGGLFDALVTDHQMPGMRGSALIAAARRLRPGLPSILLTGAADAERDFNLDFEKRNFLLLRKPIGAERLSARISALLEREDLAA